MSTVETKSLNGQVIWKILLYLLGEISMIYFLQDISIIFNIDILFWLIYMYKTEISNVSIYSFN